MGAIEDLQNMMNRDALQYPFDRLQTTAILNLAARMDEAVKKIYELELASPCPLLKSICEDWEYDAKPSPDKQEMVEKCLAKILDDLTDRRGLRQEWDCIADDIKTEIKNTWGNILSDFYEEVKHGA